MVERYPRVLILSNDPLSQESGNGRSLGNYFVGWPKERLANLHTNRQSLDLIDAHYFLLSDLMVKNHALRHQKPGEEENYPFQAEEKGQSIHSGVEKNPLTCLVRDALWRLGFYKSEHLKEWIHSFRPDIVLLQAGDFPYMFDLARKITKQEGAKLVIFNTEDYFFKNWNYLGKKSGWGWLYPLFHARFKRSFTHAMKKTSLCLYHFSGLEDLYRRSFPMVRSSTIYVSSTVAFAPYVPTLSNFKVLYAGNLSGGRFKALEDVAQALHETGLPYTFTIYGAPIDEEGFAAFQHNPFLAYGGETSYEVVSKSVESADLIVHAVAFDPFQNKDRQNEFSSKIPDCLCSGRPFLVYAPESLGFVHYLENNNCAFVASRSSELLPLLKRLMMDCGFRTSLLQNGKETASQNHDLKKNAEKMRVSLVSVCPQKV